MVGVNQFSIAVHHAMEPLAAVDLSVRGGVILPPFSISLADSCVEGPIILFFIWQDVDTMAMIDPEMEVALIGLTSYGV